MALNPMNNSNLEQLALKGFNQLGLGRCKRGPGRLPRAKTNLVHSRAVRKPLVAITLSLLKCMFYSRSIKIQLKLT